MAHSKAPVVTGVAVVFAILSFVVVTLRILSRIFIFRKVRLDDYLIIIASLLSWGFIGIGLAAVHNGLGHHMSDIDLADFQTYLKIIYVSSTFYLSCLGFVKCSVLVFYTHLENATLTRLSYIMLGVIVCQAGSFVIVAIFQCNPIRKAWSPTTLGSCVEINVFYMANAALNICTDVITYALPMKVIMQLDISRRQKIGILIILCFGLFACIASIIRITYIPAMLSSPDVTYVISDAMYWSIIETNTGILAASMPCFKAIFARFLPRLLGSSRGCKEDDASDATQSLRPDPWSQPDLPLPELPKARD
ncbi:hypothetical protein ASPWEDRAFT_112184 [Aspergillus wentii DTO 134E9]|uniref:Rhodopsin domain-containing protein n=1 Tax=Aspergillus wentii DTO 134E9 TaxID=1073089 RepID=A0A1L9RIE1_ASPWE|nr:uncharacterized protein ASPWEDRAFT_112184 [Aspergillus wentii DTO 134E9]OJJ34696.1 hypothetical protein ASPWEDRAFT_112184 [Aspergillus wentii DTO 134E9]